jgi:hypothetical protein
MADERIWFRNRAYGGGWYPATAEGWFVLALWLFILIGSTLVFLVAQLRADSFMRLVLLVLWIAVVLADTATLLYFLHAKGEKPRSHWHNARPPWTKK